MCLIYDLKDCDYQKQICNDYQKPLDNMVEWEILGNGFI